MELWEELQQLMEENERLRAKLNPRPTAHILPFNRHAKAPLTVAYGMGVDSTAVLVEFVRRAIRPDLILFADVGGEKPETYEYLPIIQEYLARNKFPEVIVVKYVPVKVSYRTLEEDCLSKSILPSLAYGRKGCSLKWKADVQNRFVRHWQPAIEAWAQGLKVRKVIGYDDSPADQRRRCHAFAMEDPKYDYWYPLQDWHWDRERCKEEIAREGLSVPLKSACFFCPASKPDELVWLNDHHPDLLRRAIALEDLARASGKLRTVEGLWRRHTRTRPGSWREFAEQNGLALPEEEYEPREISGAFR